MTKEEHRRWLIKMLTDRSESRDYYYLNDEDKKVIVEALQEPERKWIPVSERLPDNYKEVLVQWEMINRVQNTVIVYTSVGLIDEHGEWVNSDVMRLFNGRIIAWQPLPEPYKAGEQE